MTPEQAGELLRIMRSIEVSAWVVVTLLVGLFFIWMVKTA